MWAPTKTIDPDDLISLINEEFDCQKTQRERRYRKARNSDGLDGAMLASPSYSTWRSSKGSARKPLGACWNSGEVGHFRDKCPKPAKSSGNTIDEEEGAKKAGGVNAAESDWDSESEGAWAAEEIDSAIVASSGASPSLCFWICRLLACFQMWRNPLLRTMIGFTK